MAVCSADGCIGGDRGKKEPRAIQQAAGHGKEHFSVLSAGCVYKIGAEKTIGHLLHPRKACSNMVGQEGPQGSPITSGMRCKSSRTHPFPGCPALRGQPREINPPTSHSSKLYMVQQAKIQDRRGQRKIPAIRASLTAPRCLRLFLNHVQCTGLPS